MATQSTTCWAAHVHPSKTLPRHLRTGGRWVGPEQWHPPRQAWASNAQAQLTRVGVAVAAVVATSAAAAAAAATQAVVATLPPPWLLAGATAWVVATVRPVMVAATVQLVTVLADMAWVDMEAAGATAWEGMVQVVGMAWEAMGRLLPWQLLRRRCGQCTTHVQAQAEGAPTRASDTQGPLPLLWQAATEAAPPASTAATLPPLQLPRLPLPWLEAVMQAAMAALVAMAPPWPPPPWPLPAMVPPPAMALATVQQQPLRPRPWPQVGAMLQGTARLRRQATARAMARLPPQDMEHLPATAPLLLPSTPLVTGAQASATVV
mmetsp:Transcript_6329/g.16865  ORF Transcript_6329/g.16865 Transcript_6329/m.16865 type:complete len:320 (+) Transcript_6329:363-1322(+)